MTARITKQALARARCGRLILTLVLGAASCSKASGTTAAPTPASAAPVAEALPATPEGVLTGYENIRRLLAEDQITAVSAFAKRLTTAAREVVRAKSTPELPVFERIAAASATLESTDAKDPDAVRRQFGEVSRGVVELLVANESLRASRHVFDCPMAQGYRKWVQLTPAIHNPYMGAKMLECGAASTWAP